MHVIKGMFLQLIKYNDGNFQQCISSRFKKISRSVFLRYFKWKTKIILRSRKM